MNDRLTRDGAFDDEIDIRPYVLALWRGRYAILLCAALAGAAAFGIAWRTTPVYEAHAQMVLVPALAPSGPAPVVGLATLRAMIANQQLAEQVLKEFRLDRGPSHLTVHEFLDRALTVDIVPDGNLITVTVRLFDGDTAAGMANRICRLADDQVTRIGREDAASIRDTLRVQLDRARQRLDQLQGRLLGEKRPPASAPTIAPRERGPVPSWMDLLTYGPELSRLHADYDAAQSVYFQAAIRAEQSALQVESPGAQIRHIETALPPARPIAPRTLRNVIVGIVAGFILSAFVVLLVQWLRSFVGIDSGRPKPAGTAVV